MPDGRGNANSLSIGAGVALVLVGTALAWRIAFKDEPLIVRGGRDGLTIEIKSELDSASKLLDELSLELEARTAELEKAREELQSREARIQELAGQLAAASQVAAASPAVADVRSALATLRSRPIPQVEPVDPRKLTIATEKLNRAATAIRALEHRPPP